jgi:hypothetical protein
VSVPDAATEPQKAMPPMNAPKVNIVLTAYNMGGDATEEDFDKWAAHAAQHINEACGVDARVEQYAFHKGTDRDFVYSDDDDIDSDRAAVVRVRNWLRYGGWHAWCAERREEARLARAAKAKPYLLQVTGEWAGEVGGWRPAIAGTVNQTGLTDEEASTFRTHEEASLALENACLPQLTSDPHDGDPRDNAPRFRIVEVAP